MAEPDSSEYVSAIIHIAARDPSIARVLREICALDGAARASALDLVASRLRAHPMGDQVLACVTALRRDEVARRIAEALGSPA